MREVKDGRKKRRRIPRQRGSRLLAMLLLAAMLLPGGIVMPQSVAAAYGDLDDNLKDNSNTYALQVSTGTLTVNGSLADEILYFKIVYEDVDGHVRSHRIFPGENALRDSMNWAEQQGSSTVSTNTADAEGSAETTAAVAPGVDTILSSMKVSVNREETPFQAYATDTFFFQPLKEVKSIQSIEILMCDNVSESTETTEDGEKTTTVVNKASGTWTCQGMRIYKVSSVRGMGMYGCVSARQYADFDGTLIAKMESAKTFNWNSDRMFRITTDGSGDGTLTQTSESYSTQQNERVLRMDIADTYGAGISTLANVSGKDLYSSLFGECAAIAFRYQDIYGATREAYLPFATCIVAYALKNGASSTERVSGIAQEGDTVAFSASMPDLVSLQSVRIIYGTDAAKAVTGITTADAPSGEVRTVNPTQSGSSDDLLNIIGFSVYDAATTKVSVTIEDTMLRATFEGTPLSYYRAPSIAGTTIRPVSKGSSGTEITLQTYENGARLLPKDSTERYLVVLHTDDADLAGTTGELSMTLSYTDTSGQSLTSESINVQSAVETYYGEWPGVKSGFMYRVGTKSGGTMCFTVSLKDVNQFTGAKFVNKGSDDWQAKGIEIIQLEELGSRTATWQSGGISDGSQTSDRLYARDYTGTSLLKLDQTIFVDGGQDPVSVNFTSDQTVVVDTDTGDWSEYRYSMSYEVAQNLGKFAKSRYSYTVAVEVADDQVTNASDGDCGSKNQFYFQLVFEDGKSAYVLANQQLSADGFRTGYTEEFSISTNRDMGEVTAIKILPDDTSSKSDVFDKLKIASISVKKQTSEAVSRQWTVDNVGWIDINYQDESADSDSPGYRGRAESEIVKTYQIESSTYAVNLEFAITTAAYNVAADTGVTDPQFTGQLYGIVEYYDSNGALKTETYNLVDAMYTYNGREKKTGSRETIGQYTWPGGVESDTSLMFRAGKTDRFNLAIEDISQLLRIRLEVRSKVATTWNIQNVYVSLAGSSGKRIINKENEYEWKYSEEKKKLCSSTNADSGGYSINLPVNQVQVLDVEFSENQVNWSNSANGEISSVTSRLPRSANDTLNIYVYTADSESVSSLEGTVMTATAEYSRVYGGFSSTSATMTLGESNGRSMFYVKDVSASGIDTLNKLGLGAYFQDLNATGTIPLDYAVVQQVRSGVVVNTYYINFSGLDPAASSVSKAPEANPNPSQFKQVVSLSFADNLANLHLTAETDDVAVAIRYTTTNDVSGQEYESQFIYLTDQNWSELRAGKVIDLTFNESYVKEITGIKIRGTGHSTRNGVSIASATAAVYETSLSGGEERCTGNFSFAYGVTLAAGAGDQVMQRTDTLEDGSGNVSQVTISFTVPDVKDVPAVAENATGAVGMVINYRDESDVVREKSINDICAYAEDNASFQSGSTVTLRLQMSGVKEIRWLMLGPTDGAGNAAALTLSDMSITMETLGETLGYQRNLQDWSGTGIIPVFNSVQVKLTAVTKNATTNTSEQIVVESETQRQLVESGQEVVITPSVTGSSSGYTYRVEKFKDSFTTNAAETVTSENGVLRFKATNEYSSGVGTESYYRVIVSSNEVPSVQSIIEFVVEPKNVEPVTEQPTNNQDEQTTDNSTTNTEDGN